MPTVLREAMSWRDLLQPAEETLVYPWTGERTLRGADDRSWSLVGRLPPEHGWYRFKLEGRKARSGEAVPAELERLTHKICGYLVGDRLIPDGARVDPDPRNILQNSHKVHLIEEGLDRFVRISAGRIFEGGPLMYNGLEMPLGPEEGVQTAFLDQKTSVDDIPEVTPALDAVFRLETHQRVEAERRRQEEAQRLRAEEARLAEEQRRRELREQLGDGEGRRAMARVDFSQAARAALAIGGAELLDSRRSVQRGEMVIKFRVDGQRFECTCNEHTMRIIDSGICLTAHYDDEEFEHGTKGDTWLTLESLPSVIRQAVREGKLVVYRHAQ